MEITRTSSFTGKTHTKDLPVTQEQLDSYYKTGLLLQDAFPHLSADDREFIKSGVTKEEWDAMFPPEEEDEEEDKEHRCDNCENEYTDEELDETYPDITDLGMRTEPGGTIPSGTCPSCGALCFLMKED
jgi:hypothetical protein